MGVRTAFGDATCEFSPAGLSPLDLPSPLSSAAMQLAREFQMTNQTQVGHTSDPGNACSAAKPFANWALVATKPGVRSIDPSIVHLHVTLLFIH
jgi:hypothetical protein